MKEEEESGNLVSRLQIETVRALKGYHLELFDTHLCTIFFCKDALHVLDKCIILQRTKLNNAERPVGFINKHLAADYIVVYVLCQIGVRWRGLWTDYSQLGLVILLITIRVDQQDSFRMFESKQVANTQDSDTSLC